MKTVYKLLLGIVFLTSFSIVISSCVKDEYDEPEPYEFKVGFSSNTSIADLKQLFDGDTTLIGDSIIISGTVISTDKHGNFYKEIIIQDSTGGIAISIDRSSLYNDYPLGSQMFVKCGGMYLGESNSVIKLGGLYEEDGVFKFGRIQSWSFVQEHCFRDDFSMPITPDTITLDQFNSSRINTLVVINDVEFTEIHLGRTFATPGGTSGMNRQIEDCDPNTEDRDLRTSDFADFAGDTIPSGKGSLKAVLSAYNNEYQLVLNSIEEIDFSGERCIDPNIITQDFSAGFDDWTTVSVTGNQVWEISSQYGNPAPCAVISGYDNGNYENEDWLISPAFNANEHDNLILNFESASNYSGSDIEVLISTNYSGSGDPNQATWVALSATLSNSWTWVSSGDIDISNYNGENVYVAFKYTSTNSDGKTWELDNIIITDPNL